MLKFYEVTVIGSNIPEYMAKCRIDFILSILYDN